jgi:hypothetical protein
VHANKSKLEHRWTLLQCTWTGDCCTLSERTWGPTFLCHCVRIDRNILLCHLLYPVCKAILASYRWALIVQEAKSCGWMSKAFKLSGVWYVNVHILLRQACDHCFFSSSFVHVGVKSHKWFDKLFSISLNMLVGDRRCCFLRDYWLSCNRNPLCTYNKCMFQPDIYGELKLCRFMSQAFCQRPPLKSSQ